MYSSSSSLTSFLCLLTCAANLVACLEIKNHDTGCAVVTRNKNFERCELTNSNVALCEDGFVKVRGCLPERKSCLVCSVDNNGFLRKIKHENSVVAVLPLSGRIWTSGPVSINGISHSGLNEVLLDQSETVLINNRTYKFKTPRPRVKRKGGRSASSRTTYRKSYSSYHKSSSYHWYGGSHHYHSSSTGGGGASDGFVILIVAIVIILLIALVIWACEEYQSYEEESTVVREESMV